MAKRQTSLKDLAQALNVSVSTVSRALKNHPDISPALSHKIQELAKSMKYSPNPLAMGLLRRQTRTIGVIIPDIVTHFFSSVISGIEDIASKEGYYVVVTSSSELFEKEKLCVENLVHLRVEGVIACVSRTTADYSHYDLFQEAGIPLVFIDRVCRTDEFSSVIADNTDAAREITRYFYQSGCRKISYISGPDHLNICRERLQGYMEGLQQCKLFLAPGYSERCEMDMESATNAVKRLLALKDRPDAVFGINDMVMFAAIKEIKNQHLRIPEDISVIGFTDDFHATFIEPALTSVVHPAFEMGQQAASLLLEQSKSETDLPVKQIKLNTHLVVRDSTKKV
ncbi:MAG: LacI family transcriptional regulator [Bacteroidetes bacterium]|nr:LacI family transcriptional regulator [Bacteroidota bacterium]